MDTSQITQSLVQAIDTIAESKIMQAGFNMTIQATILTCEDESQGLYKVRYQDSILRAYAQVNDNTYAKNASVYILVPNSDFSKKLTIIGTVARLGENYISVIQGTEDAYDKIGNNLITNTEEELGVCSFHKESILLLYDADLKENLIQVDSFGAEEYMKQTSTFLIAANFKTNLVKDQQEQGNYGLRITLDFVNQSSEALKSKEYIFDISDMTGQPFVFTTPSRQSGVYNYSADFSRIKKIELFAKDFPLNDENIIDNDIFVSDLELYAVQEIGEGLTSYHLNIETPYGTYFKDNNFKELVLNASLKENGKTVGVSNQNLYYYWFIQDSSINTTSDEYNSYGKQGWRCLNSYKIEQVNNDSLKIWDAEASKNYSYIIRKDDMLVYSNVYKCVAVYNNNIVFETQEIKNYNYNYQVEIIANGSTKFNNDIGKVSLTCNAYSNGELLTENLTYYWGNIDMYGNYYSLPETEALNNEYNTLVTEIAEIERQIAEGADPADFPELPQKQARVKEIETYFERIYQNHYDNLPAYKIEVKESFSCSVYLKDTFIGTAEIEITNGTTSEGYNLKINSDNLIFKYNEAGVSPTSPSLGSAAAAHPLLSFIMYDKEGIQLLESDKNNLEVEWFIPLDNTLLIVDYEQYEYEIIDNTVCIKGVQNLPFDIENLYDINKTNNTVKLQVVYKDELYIDYAIVNFLKEGNPGTNGTEYSVTMEICKPINSNFTNEYNLPIVEFWNYMGTSTSSLINFQSNNQKWLKFIFWHNGEKIFEGTNENILGGLGGLITTEGQSINSLKWSLLKNTKDYSIYNVTEDGQWATNSFEELPQSFSNIAKVSFSYNAVEYVAFMPIITIVHNQMKVDSEYTIVPQKGGFSSATYSTDGKSAIYDVNSPFEIKAFDKNEIDITNSENFNFEWKSYGLDEKIKIDKNKQALIRNICYASPEDDYNGYSTDNGIQCDLYTMANVDNSSEPVKQVLASVYIPIHLTLNRYGNSAINGWDGNGVTLNSDGDVLLAPQMGAGKKEADNSFTGLVMGMKQTSDGNSDIGLFGYNAGSQTIFLDAESGKAEFGVGNAKIVLDPTIDLSGNPVALISANFNATRGTGMQINLTDPSIQWGNNNFSVDKDGFLTATGVEITGDITCTNLTATERGNISCWELSKTAFIANDILDSKYDERSDSTDIYLGTAGIGLGKGNFRVSPDGVLTLKEGGKIVVGSMVIDKNGIKGGSISQAEITTTGASQADEFINTEHSFYSNTKGNTRVTNLSVVSMDNDKNVKTVHLFMDGANGIQVSDKGTVIDLNKNVFCSGFQIGGGVKFSDIKSGVLTLTLTKEVNYIQLNELNSNIDMIDYYIDKKILTSLCKDETGWILMYDNQQIPDSTIPTEPVEGETPPETSVEIPTLEVKFYYLSKEY